MVGRVKSWKRKGKRQFPTLRDMLHAYAHKKRQEAAENAPAGKSDKRSAPAPDWDEATTLRHIKEDQLKFAKSRKLKQPSEAPAPPLQLEFERVSESCDGVASRPSIS